MVDIPTLDIEDYDPDLNEEAESTEDQSGGALTYAIVGAGQGGGQDAARTRDHCDEHGWSGNGHQARRRRGVREVQGARGAAGRGESKFPLSRGSIEVLYPLRGV